MNTYIGKVQIGSQQASVGSTLYGVCSSLANANNKQVTLPDFDNDIHGVTVYVKFNHGNSVSSGVKLQVGGTSAHNVLGDCICKDGEILEFTMDRTNTSGNITENSTDWHWIAVGHVIEPATATPSQISTQGAVGTSSKYAREDHTHAILVTEGTNNGEITIAGTSIAVKGLGSAAYTDANTYATAAQGVLAQNAMPKSGGTFTGPVILNGAPTSNLEAATKAYVDSEISNVLTGSADAMIFKGTLGASTATPVPTITSVPTNSYGIGDTYRIVTEGTYAEIHCEIGDLIIAIHQGPATGTEVIEGDWVVAQGNIDGAVIGPSSSTGDNVVLFDGNTGKLIKDSGKTLGKSVPANAIFTDTTYTITNGSAYTTHTLIDETRADVASSVDQNGASILASVNQGVLTLAAGIKFTTGTVAATLNGTTNPQS